jgi:hypothetical protein
LQRIAQISYRTSETSLHTLEILPNG